MTALKHASLVGQDLAGLVPGRSVLTDLRGGLFVFGGVADAVCITVTGVGKTLSYVCSAALFTYIGELQHDGFINRPEGGWTACPYPGNVIEAHCGHDDGVMVAGLSDGFSWKPDGGLPVVAFRPTPAGDLGASAAPIPGAASGETVDQRAAYLRDNLDTVLDAVTDMAKVGIEVCKQTKTYQTEDRDRARIEFIAEVCRRWAAPGPASQVGMEAEGRNESKAPSNNPAGEVERLRAALKPFADASARLHTGYDDGIAAGDRPMSKVFVSDLRNAAAALEASQ